VAVADRIARTLGWQPRHDDLKVIVRDALAWETRLGSGEAADAAD
jgi:UDP-glucose 4-epimerase